MIITFVRNGKAFLPEIIAYTKFFEAIGIDCKTTRPEELGRVKTDVEWHFMGVDRVKTKQARIKVHEYASCSTGKWRKLRDMGKKLLTVQPDFRIFLNDYVKETFGFKDRVPFGYRDMGVDEKWLDPSRVGNPFQYDFVYIGDLSPARRPERLLSLFEDGPVKDRTLLLVSNHFSLLQNQFRKFSNIIFTGPCDHSAIPSVLAKAKFGINYVIDQEPYNNQTSTKFLEYAACGLPIVTTNYKWVKDFQRQYGGEYYYLTPDLANFKWEAISEYEFSKPELSQWTWNQQIKNSGIVEFLGTL